MTVFPSLQHPLGGRRGRVAFWVSLGPWSPLPLFLLPWCDGALDWSPGFISREGAAQAAGMNLAKSVKDDWAPLFKQHKSHPLSGLRASVQGMLWLWRTTAFVALALGAWDLLQGWVVQSSPFTRGVRGWTLRNCREKTKGRNNITVFSAQSGSVTSHPAGWLVLSAGADCYPCNIRPSKTRWTRAEGILPFNRLLCDLYTRVWVSHHETFSGTFYYRRGKKNVCGDTATCSSCILSLSYT